MENFRYQLTEHASEQVSKRNIQLEWIEQVLQSPIKTKPDDKDPELRVAYGVIPEKDDRILRVVYNFTVEPWKIVTAHFDRNATSKHKRGVL